MCVLCAVDSFQHFKTRHPSSQKEKSSAYFCAELFLSEISINKIIQNKTNYFLLLSRAGEFAYFTFIIGIFEFLSITMPVG